MANKATKKKSFWDQYKLPILLLGGIAVGSILGIISPAAGKFVKPVGDIFLNLLFTIVVPVAVLVIGLVIFLRRRHL